MKNQGAFSAWLTLLRVPNLFTVVLEPVVGYVCVTGNISLAALLPPVISVLLLYVSGLLFSDLADQEKDAEERPDRPLPSGGVTPVSVAIAGWSSLVAAIAIIAITGTKASFIVPLLAVFVLIYVRLHSEYPKAGALIMASCRSMAILAGAGAAGMPLKACVPAAVAFIYIFLLTLCAAGEARKPSLAFPAGVSPALILCMPLFMATSGTWGFQFYFVCFFAIMGSGSIVWSAWLCSNQEIPVPRHIGMLVRTIIFIQGAWIMLYWLEPDVKAVTSGAAGILGLRLLSEYMGRQYSSS